MRRECAQVASNWSPSGVPSVASSDHMVFDGSSAQTSLTFLQGTFNNSPGLGNITLAATQTAALTMNNAGTAGAVFRLNANSSVSIAAGAGAFSMGTGGNTFLINLSNGGSGNTFTNNSSNPAVIGTAVSINASSGTNGLAIFDGSGDWDITGLLTASVSRGVTKNGTGTLTLTGTSAYTGPTVVNGGPCARGLHPRCSAAIRPSPWPTPPA